MVFTLFINTCIQTFGSREQKNSKIGNTAIIYEKLTLKITTKINVIMAQLAKRQLLATIPPHVPVKLLTFTTVLTRHVDPTKKTIGLFGFLQTLFIIAPVQGM